MKESDIQKRILVYLNRRKDIFAWKAPNQGMRVGGGIRVKCPMPGLPDIIGYNMNSGRAIFIEVKTPEGKISDDQMEFITRATKAGCLAFFARSLDDVKAVFLDVDI